MFSATMQQTSTYSNHHFYHSYPFLFFSILFPSFFISFFLSSFFVTFHHFFFISFITPPPPSPTAATPVSLKVRVRDFCYSLTVIFLLYNNVCIVFSITIFNIKFKCGLGLLDELYYLVPRPNHLAICLVIINVI